MNIHHLATIWQPLFHWLFGECCTSESLFALFTHMFLECYFHNESPRQNWKPLSVVIKEGKIPKKFNKVFFCQYRSLYVRTVLYLTLLLENLLQFETKPLSFLVRKGLDKKSYRGTWQALLCSCSGKPPQLGRISGIQHRGPPISL